MRDIQMLDCTLRDGGLGLEDAAKTDATVHGFTHSTITKLTECLKSGNLDIIELGSIELSELDKRKYAIYQSIEEVSRTIPSFREGGSMYVALYRGPDTPIEDIPAWREGLCEGVRVILRYSELKKSLDFCAALARKGYKVFVQPMLTMRYSDTELQYVIDASNDMDAFSLYFVDSYGYMQPSDVLRLADVFDKNLLPKVRLGFHAHNNMNMAYTNALAFLRRESARALILDACITGMGQGAGNLQTELIAPFLIKEYGKKYDYSAILEACDIIDDFLPSSLWGYSVTRLLPALHATAYKYALAMRNQYQMTFSQINKVLELMPIELRHRYTPEATRQLLNEVMPEVLAGPLHRELK